MSSTGFLEKAIRKELASTNEALSIAGIQNDVDGYITPEQLSREKAETIRKTVREMSFDIMENHALREEIQEAFTKNNVNEVAAAVRIAHEATRARRDIQIIECSHKKLLLGCYRTMYQRKLKLENRLRNEDYV